jgi:hypothetical protein
MILDIYMQNSAKWNRLNYINSGKFERTPRRKLDN